VNTNKENSIQDGFLERINKHLTGVNETYWQHFFFAMTFGFRLLFAAGAAFVHALIPCIFEKTASNRVHAMHDFLSNRNASDDKEK
jgi:hypothetical protein